MTESDHQTTFTILFNASLHLMCWFVFGCLFFSCLLGKQVQVDCEFVFGVKEKENKNPIDASINLVL